MHYYDLWHGMELKPAVHGSEATISFNIEGLGFGAILAAESPLSDAPKNLLAYMAERSKRPLSSYSRDWKFLPQATVEIPPTKLAQTPPPGMVRIPEGEYDFQVRGIEIEGGNDPGVDVQYPWEDAPRRLHRQRGHIASFLIECAPVATARCNNLLDGAS